MALFTKIVVTTLFLFGATVFAEPKVYVLVLDPVEDYLKGSLGCSDNEAGVLRYVTDSGEVLLTSDFSVRNKVGPWWRYKPAKRHFIKPESSESRENGDWILKVQYCPCSKAIGSSCNWENWQQRGAITNDGSGQKTAK